MRSGQHISELVCEGTDRLQVCTGNNCRTVVGGAAWGEAGHLGHALRAIACL